MKVSVVIPCYRSENTITGVVDEIRTTLSERPEYDYEIILVNDCSPDCVWDKIRFLCEQDKHVRGISFAKNFGQHAALMAGYKATSGDVIVSMDDDGQTDSHEMFKLIDKLEEGFDVVYADYPNKKESAFRLMGSHLNERMNEKMLGKPKGIVPNSYFVLRSYLVKEMIRYENAFPYVDGLIFRATKNIGKVEVEHRERLEGTSGYTLGKLISLWLNGFTAFSIRPLRFATIIGCLCATAGFVAGIVQIILRALDTTPVQGWASLFVLILFIGGMNMLMLGMAGEYIGRIYLCINNSPQYVIKETKNL